MATSDWVHFRGLSLLSLGSRLWLFGLFELWIFVGLGPKSCRGCSPSLFLSFSLSLSSVVFFVWVSFLGAGLFAVDAGCNIGVPVFLFLVCMVVVLDFLQSFLIPCVFFVWCLGFCLLVTSWPSCRRLADFFSGGGSWVWFLSEESLCYLLGVDYGCLVFLIYGFWWA